MPPKREPKKKAPPKGPKGMAKPLNPGILMSDLVKKQWKLGPVIGQGGFGYIYLGSPASAKDVTVENAENVIKVEPHQSGPLFVELAFYQKAAKPDMVSNWMNKIKKNYVGVPVYIATGSFEDNNIKYRFLVMQRFGTDVEKIYKKSDYKFPEQTVFSLGLRVLDALEYMHEHEYCHADIKSSNLMMGHKKSDQSKMYLLDFGLAYRFNPNGVHAKYKEDPKRKHDGTIEYTSRDAHKGCVPSRRGDLEILGYCMVQWLCKKLPWENKLTDKEYVMKEKIKHMNNIPDFIKTCFPDSNDRPGGELEDYLGIVEKLDYDEKPDYVKIRNLFCNRLKKLGCKDDGVSVIYEADKKSPSVSQKRGRPQANDDETSPRKRTKKVSSPSPKSSPMKTLKQNGVQSSRTPNKSTSKAARSRNKVISPLKKSPLKVATPKKRKSPKQTLTPKKNLTPRKNPTPRKAHTRLKSPVETKSLNREEVKWANRNNAAVNGTDSSNAGKQNKMVHLRPRKKNVPMRDFGQSP